MTATFEYARKLNLIKITASTAVDNEKMVRIFSKKGFYREVDDEHPEGRPGNGQLWIDYVLDINVES